MVVTAAVWPLVYATLAFLMFRATDQAPSLLYAALGAAVMGIWSTTATSAGGAIQQQRWYGVLELLVAAPSRLILVLAPITVAIAGIGVYSIASTLLWGRLLFGVPVHISHPLLFAISIPAAVLSIGLLGLVLASTLVLYRSASSLSQALEYPIWTITGMLIPLSLLPAGSTRSPGCSRRPGACARFATRRSAATSASRSLVCAAAEPRLRGDRGRCSSTTSNASPATARRSR